MPNSTYNNAAELSGAAKGLPEHGLIAVAWAGFGLAAFFVAFRMYARITEAHRLFTDDYWMLAALMFLVVNAILQTLQTPSLYYLVYVSVGRVPAGQALLDDGNVYVRYEFVVIAFFWTVTWCVKASFLALYWRLFDGLPGYRKIWWGVVVFTALAYVGCWMASVWTCHPPSTYFDFGQCSKPIDTRGSVISISYSTAVDILSDIFIMVLPLRLLPTLQINTRQKIGLGGIFCVGFVIIAVAIVRLTQIIGQERADPVGLAVWGLVESSVSVIVGCLPALKSLLSRAVERTFRKVYATRAGRGTGSSTARSNGYIRSKGGKSGAGMDMDDTFTNSNGHHRNGSAIQMKDPYNNSSMAKVSKDQIMVQTDYSWTRSDESEMEAGNYDDEARIINGASHPGASHHDIGLPHAR